MTALKWKEYDTGKLYFSAVASQVSLISIEDINGKPVKTRLSEAITMCIFPEGFESNLHNQKKFLAACHSEGILPAVQIYDLSAKNRKSSALQIVLITGSFDEYIKYEKMFYLPQAESIFENTFHSNDWSLINPKSSESNVAQKGYWISNLDPFEDLLKEIRDGGYFIDQSIFKPAADFGESFALVIAKGYTSDYLEPAELFKILQESSEKLPSPFETEMIVANGPGISGDVLIFYFENSFNGMPENFGSIDFSTLFVQNWLNKIVSVKSPDYIIEYYGPRSYKLEKYWPGINILKKKRLSANDQNPDVEIEAEEQAEQQTELEFTETQSKIEDEITENELPADTILEIPGYPLGFRLNSVEIKQAHKYLSGTSESELKASPNYRLLVAGITVQNKTEYFMRFSSVQFSVLKKSGEKVDALLYGVGTSVVESGRILSVESKVTGQDEKPVVSLKGKLSEDVAFFEWILSPGKSYEDNLIYLIPSTESNPDLKFTHNNKPLRHTGESPIKIAFNSQEIQQSYQYTSGSSQIESTAASEYRFLVAKVTMTNNAEVSVRFSSENFSILDNSGKKISATFFGAENHIAQNGKITSFESNIDNPDKKEEAKITGVLNPSVSFIEWELGPNYSRQETLVFLIPSNATNVRLHFDYCLGDGKHYTVTSSSDKGCFIATATYGSPLAREVRTLYEFRDVILSKSKAGRSFVSFYYRFSPVLSRHIEQHRLLKKVSALALKPVIYLAKYSLKTSK